MLIHRDVRNLQVVFFESTTCLFSPQRWVTKHRVGVLTESDQATWQNSLTLRKVKLFMIHQLEEAADVWWVVYILNLNIQALTGWTGLLLSSTVHICSETMMARAWMGLGEINWSMTSVLSWCHIQCLELSYNLQKDAERIHHRHKTQVNGLERLI